MRQISEDGSNKCCVQFFVLSSYVTGTDVMIFVNIFAEKFSEKIGVFLLKLLLVFAKNVIICNIGFSEKHHFFRRTLAKIAENCVHNIDP
jgi:hypothetical protein